nr:unnamed protein product [Digitaria exilis]
MAAAEFVLLVAAATFTFLLVTTRAQAQSVGASCQERDMDGLLAFKQGINSDPNGILASWRSDGHGHEEECCRWRGVRCNNRTGHVVELRLGDTDLYDGYALVGEISDSLLSLEHLEYLYLSMNSLEGSSGRIPDFLGPFKNLKYLNLSGIPSYSILTSKQ